MEGTLVSLGQCGWGPAMMAGVRSEDYNNLVTQFSGPACQGDA